MATLDDYASTQKRRENRRQDKVRNISEQTRNDEMLVNEITRSQQ